MPPAARPLSVTPLRRVVRCGVAGSAVLLAVAAAACDGSIPTPSNDLTTGQAFIDLNAQLVQFREDNALLQQQIDSLRNVTAYQDTIVRQLAAAAGISMRPPAVPFP